MNDPGLDDPISNAGGEVQEKYSKDTENDVTEEDEERDFLLPAKWWYASTAFPLMAGTFGPMANAFSICALVENWRVNIPKEGTEEHGIDIKDPSWLIAVNAVSLVFALIANMSLLLNMARRLSFKVAQPITILGFWIASVLLIGLIVKAAHDFHAPGVKDQALSQAYYYAIFAAGLYQIISYLMCVTAWGAWRGHFSKEFKLTMAQRTLMLQTIAYLTYLLLGALVYSRIEGWEFLDAVYWADFTTLTIGIGDDYAPDTHLGRGLLFPFALGGIIILGLVVGSIRSLVLDRSAKKLGARITEKTRRRVVKRVAKATDNKNTQQAQKGIPGLDAKTAGTLVNDDKVTEMQRRRAEFEAMRRVQAMAANEQKWISLLTSTLAFALLWFIGGLVFWYAESNQQWSYFESIYFSYTTLLTIGYGDFQPISNSGRPFFVFWSLLAIPTLTILISDMGDTVVKGIKDLTIWLGEVTVLPSDQGGLLDRLKYGLYKITLGRINLKNSGPEPDDNADEELDDDMKRFQEMNPGLTHMYPRQDEKRYLGRHKRNKHDIETGNELAKDFEKSEKDEEHGARERGDSIAEDEHHYRHILIGQLRKVWNDTNGAEPKKYSYAEWAYYLRLLGEDENDKRFHRKAPAKKIDPKPVNKDQAKQNKEHGGQKDAEGHGVEGQPHTEMPGYGVADTGGTATKWSWIGTRSPLMGEKDESEWLLEKLFQRLEDSLKEHWEEHKKADKREERAEEEKKVQRRENEADGRVRGSGSQSRPSSGTLDGSEDDGKKETDGEVEQGRKQVEGDGEGENGEEDQSGIPEESSEPVGGPGLV